MSTALLDSDHVSGPLPLRFWWLKRLAAAYGLLAIAMVGAWFGWDAVAKHRVAAEIASIRAAGEPAMPEDYPSQPTLPADQNAAPVLMAATRFTYTKPQNDLDQIDIGRQQLTIDEQNVLRTFRPTFPAQLAGLHQARTMTQGQWTGRPLTMGSFVSGGMRYLSDLHGLANLARYAAIADHLDGDDASAIETLRDLLHASDLFQNDSRLIIDDLVAGGMSAMTATLVIDMADELAIDSPPGARRASTQPAMSPHPASRAQVLGLIAGLLDERSARAGVTQAMQGERVLDLNFAADPLPGLALMRFPPLPAVLVLPAIRLDAIRESQYDQALGRAMEADTLPAITATMPPRLLNPKWTYPSMIAHLMARMGVGGLLRYPSTRSLELTMRRVAAVKLAIRLYEHDHAGADPKALAELVPAYLPAVPDDPFAAAGQKLRYIPSMIVDGVDTPVIYSVAENGKDDHASTRSSIMSYDSMLVSSTPWHRDDADFLVHLPPLPAPATQP